MLIEKYKKILDNEDLNKILKVVRQYHSTNYGYMAIGDSRKLIEYLPNNFFSTIITSPPYFDLKDYEHKNQIGNGQSYMKFLEDLEHIFSKCYDACNNNSSLWLIVDDFTLNKKPVHFTYELIKILEEIGWRYRDTIIWYKDRTIPYYSAGHFRKAFEYILFFSKNDIFKFYNDRIREINDLSKWWVTHPERYRPMGKMPSDIWEIPLQFQGAWGGKEYPRHLCPFPFELVHRILTLVTDKNDIVFDPFAGTGSVLAQANAMERYFIGFEIKGRFLIEFKNKTIPAADKYFHISNHNFDDRFSSIIIFLRVLKYCSTLIKEFRKETMNKEGTAKLPECAFVLIDQKNISNPSLPFPVNILFLWKRDNLSEIEKEKILSLINKKPLSWFQVIPSIQHYKNIKSLNNKMKNLNIKNLYYYTVGNTHKYSKIILSKHLTVNLEKINNGNKTFALF